MTWHCDLAVIGGGPAGLAAATEAAELGLEVHLFDEQPRLGGQVYRNVESVAHSRPDDWTMLSADYQRGLTLVEAFHNSSATFVPNSRVWDIKDDGSLSISQGGNTQIIRARHILLACGAMERPVPIPGWTLPGVMSVGAVQTLLKASGLVPDVPVIIAGSGPLIYLAAWQLLQAGVPLKAVLFTSRRYLDALPELANALCAGDYLWQGLAWNRAIRRAGVPLLGNVRRLRAIGEEHVEAVSFEINGKPHRLKTDMLLLHEGVVPNIQLGLLAGCDHYWDDLQHCWRPRIDRRGTTNIDTVSIAGDAGGINGALAAVGFGRLAALTIAYKLGKVDAAERERRTRLYQPELNRNLRIRRFLDKLFEPAAEIRIPAEDSTLVCRCEEVTAGEIRRVARLGCTGANQMKAFTRCGMGPCQGRMCGLTVTEIIAAEQNMSAAEVGHYRVRAPVKPVTLGEIATITGVD
jgi:NADPH-dependent 2,4-dienoyl-CoA reductase/sulfur reductase-like enzyme